MNITIILVLSIAIGIGIAVGYLLRWVVTLGMKGSIELEIKRTMLTAQETARSIIDDANKKSSTVLEALKETEGEKEQQFKKIQERHIKKDEILDKRQADLDEDLEELKGKIVKVKQIQIQIADDKEQAEKELERTAHISREQAYKELVTLVETQHEEDVLIRIKKLEKDSNDRLKRKAQDILSTSIQRLASSTASETMTTTVSIPSDDIKGKVIGKEGRNIRTFERSAGVELIIDDTPGSIIISSFDPIRRQVARVALENLILDGRIQPVKIEEAIEHAREEVNNVIKEKGEQATYECGVFNLDPRIVSILGRLYYRTSYGQNVLQHSIEMAHISGMLAEELGGNVDIARAGALLHDIGKAVDHEVQGTHVNIGRKILQKFGADEKIIAAMQSHHEEYPYETLESVIVQTADAISGGRPGARRDSVENYLKRLRDLEAIATSFDGVEKAYALQAGREIRVFVTPQKVSDVEARNMARSIALRVESELKYPGEIRVNVIRESRSIEFAR